MKTGSLKPYTPSREDPALLRERTVGRDDLIDVIVGRLVTAATSKNRIHTLLVGPRGSGKSHVIEAALYDLDQHEEADQLRVVRLAEDVIGLAGYTDLLVELAGQLKQQGVMSTTPVEFRGLGSDTERQCAIRDAVGDQVIVVVAENLNRLFASIGLEGQWSLRAWVETDRIIALLAATPLLDEALDVREAPWFGGFAVSHLDDLTPEQGRELLELLHVDDQDTVDYLATPEALHRLEALHHLTGGSPRVWLIAGLCLTIASLEELVPAVEDLLENLVPYYQERLWELPANEQELVIHIARASSATVKDLAGVTGIDERTAAKALSRLEAARWVRKTKLEGQDQRLSFYELREPLLRHHLDYRGTGRGPLSVIVQVLRIWFDPDARMGLLGAVELPPTTAMHLAESLANEPLPLQARNSETLRASARLWAAGTDPDLGTVKAGNIIVEILDDDSAAVAARLWDAAHEAGDRDTADVLLLVAATFDTDNPQRGLAAIDARLDQPVTPDRRWLEYLLTSAYLTGEVGEPNEALRLYTEVLVDFERILGTDHPDTLAARHQVAYLTGEVGEPNEALRLSTEVLVDFERILGTDHPKTLPTRSQVAYWTGEVGEPNEALRLYTEVLVDCERILGTDHPDTLTARSQVAYWTGEVGEPNKALRLYTELLPVLLLPVLAKLRGLLRRLSKRGGRC